jgi:hypothetical protein
MVRTSEQVLKLLTLVGFIVIGLAGVYAARGMYSDGAYWLVEMLPRGGFYIFDPHRAHVQVLVQAPVAFAIWLGTLDLNFLIRLHSVGFICVPLAFWLGALALQMKSRLFWLFLLAFTVSYLRSNFFAAGEFSSAYAMTAFCASVLLRPKVTISQALSMLVTAGLLVKSYEATLFLGSFLIGLTTLRLFKELQDERATRILFKLSIFLFLWAAYIGARSTFFQRAYDGKGAANLGALTELHLLYLMVIPALIGWMFTKYARSTRRWLGMGIVVLAGIYVIYSLRWDPSNISYGYYSYAYRALCCFLLIGVLSLAALIRFWPNFFTNAASAETSFYIQIAAIAFFGSMAWLMLHHTYGYYKWAQRFERVAVELRVNTPIDKTAINTIHGLTYGYNWMWGNPSTSILLRGNAEAIVLNNSIYMGQEQSIYENLKASDSKESGLPSKIDLYPLKPYIKPSLLFP